MELGLDTGEEALPELTTDDLAKMESEEDKDMNDIDPCFIVPDDFPPDEPVVVKRDVIVEQPVSVDVSDAVGTKDLASPSVKRTSPRTSSKRLAETVTIFCGSDNGPVERPERTTRNVKSNSFEPIIIDITDDLSPANDSSPKV